MIDERMDGRMIALSSLVAHALAALAEGQPDRAVWLDNIERWTTPDVDPHGRPSNMRIALLQQIKDTMGLARTLAGVPQANTQPDNATPR